MEMQEKIEALAEALDQDASALTPETELDQIGWDSMAILSVIALAKAQFDKKISGAEIREFTTVGDILAALG